MTSKTSRGWVFYGVEAIARMYFKTVQIPMGGREDDVYLSSIYPITDEVLLNWLSRVDKGEASHLDETVGEVACTNCKWLKVKAGCGLCGGKGLLLITGVSK